MPSNINPQIKRKRKTKYKKKISCEDNIMRQGQSYIEYIVTTHVKYTLRRKERQKNKKASNKSLSSELNGLYSYCK